jgi:hypothetical protein
MKRKLRLTLRARITLMIFGLLSSTLLLTLMAFNLAVNRYVGGSVEDQLEITAAMVRNYTPPAIIYEPDSRLLMPSLTHQPRNPVGARAQLFAVNGDYQVVAPVLADEDNAARIQAITSWMQKESLPLGTEKNTYIETAAGNFYITTVALSASSFRRDYLVLYADVTDIMNFSRHVNFLLMAVIASAPCWAPFWLFSGPAPSRALSGSWAISPAASGRRISKPGIITLKMKSFPDCSRL